MNVPIELAPYEDILAGALRPSLVLTPVPVLEALPVLSTKLGGLPDLPPDTPWPVGATENPLPFLCQLNLTDLAERFPGLLPWPTGGGMMQIFTTGDDSDYALLINRDLNALRPATPTVEPSGEIRLDSSVRGCLPDDDPSPDPAKFNPLWSLSDQLARDQPAIKTLLDQWISQFNRPHFGTWLQVGGDGLWIQDTGYGDAWAKEWAHQHGRDLYDIPYVNHDDYERERVARWNNARERARAEGWQVVFNLRDDWGCFYLVAPPDAAGHWNLDRLQVLYQGND